MVAFSRLAFALAVTGFSCAQSFNGELPSNLPSGMPPMGTGMPSGAFPSGAAQPSDHMHGGHGHRGPRPSGVAQAQHAHDSGVPFGTGMPSGFPSGMARPTGGMHGGHGGHGGHGSKLSEPTGSFSAVPTGVEKRQDSGEPSVKSPHRHIPLFGLAHARTIEVEKPLGAGPVGMPDGRGAYVGIAPEGRGPRDIPEGRAPVGRAP